MTVIPLVNHPACDRDNMKLANNLPVINIKNTRTVTGQLNPVALLQIGNFVAEL